MAQYQNKVFLIGYTGQDPESRTFEGGGGVTNVNLATTRSWKKKGSDEWDEETTWHRLVFYGRQADQVADQVRKGMRLSIEGYLRTRRVEKDGDTRFFTDVVVDRFINLTPKDRQVASADSALDQYPAQDNQESKSSNWTDPDDDLPF